MDPTPPTPGSRIQHLGDRLIVRFRPVRSWGDVAFLVFWVALWTVGGIAAVGALLTEGWGARPFLLLWLCGWAAGEVGVVVVIAWQLRGRVLLIVTPEQLEVRKEIGRFARSRVYDATRVQTVEAAPVPPDDEGPIRTDFCLKVINEDKSVEVGEGMSEREAEEVAATVREFIRPRSWWGEEDKVPLKVWRPPAEQSRRGPLLAAILLALIAAVTVWGFLYGDRAKSPATQPGPTMPPIRNGYSSVFEYASAQTAYALGASGTTVLGQPRCNGDATVAHWVCTVTARSTTPPFAGRTMLYRCEAIDGGTRCGPARQPPIGG
jgi:hypothetical protein